MRQEELGFLNDHKKEIPHLTGASTWNAKYVKPLLFGGVGGVGGVGVGVFVTDISIT